MCLEKHSNTVAATTIVNTTPIRSHEISTRYGVGTGLCATAGPAGAHQGHDNPGGMTILSWYSGGHGNFCHGIPGGMTIFVMVVSGHDNFCHGILGGMAIFVMVFRGA